MEATTALQIGNLLYADLYHFGLALDEAGYDGNFSIVYLFGIYNQTDTNVELPTFFQPIYDQFAAWESPMDATHANWPNWATYVLGLNAN